MDSNTHYFLALVAAFLKNIVPPKPTNIDWGKIYDLASMHCLGGAVYLSVQKLDNIDKPEPAILNKFKSDFFYATLRYEEQDIVYNQIIEILNKEKIDHLFFKGILLRDYYPVKEMRTLGDIDFLVKEQDQHAVKSALIRMGYKNISSFAHEKYQKGKIIIESHDKIINNQINSKVDYFAYFENVWDMVIARGNGHTYELDLSYHFVFLIAHIAKHFYICGAGVRMILDIAILIDKFGDTLDFSFIWMELKKIELDVFAQNIFGLCDRWFKVKTSSTSFNIDKQTYEYMSKYILDGGTFGFSNYNVALQVIRSSYSKTENHKIAQIKAFFGKIFLNFTEMKKKYPNLKKRPYLLPIVSIHRYYICITKKRTRTINILKGLLKGTEQAQQSYDMMKRVGLD